MTRRTQAEYQGAIALAKAGLSDVEVAGRTGIPRSTVRDWRYGLGGHGCRSRGVDECPRCGRPDYARAELAAPAYAYMLGMYLGDGYLTECPQTPGIWYLRIFLDLEWPGVIAMCRRAIGVLFPENVVGLSRPDPESDCMVVSVSSRHVPCAFPQHGPGPKYKRQIVLEDWQRQIVERQPEAFLRGLLHSDGCSFDNKVKHNGREYVYRSYTFTNMSTDILGFFTATCDQLRILWRWQNRRKIAVTRRNAVSALDALGAGKS